MSIALRDGLKTRCLTIGAAVLSNYSPWFDRTEFHNPYGTQWEFVTQTHLSLCAAMYVETKTQKYLDMVTQGYDYSLANFTAPARDGGYYAGQSKGDGIAITGLERITYATYLGHVTYVLFDIIDKPRRAAWIESLKRNIDYEERTDAFWYANGNWVAEKVRNLWYMQELCKLTNDVDFKFYNDLYEQYISFLISPATTPTPGYPTGNSLWAGYGNVVTISGPQQWADKSDRHSYLTEVNGGPPMPNAGAGSSSDGIAPFSTYDGEYGLTVTLDHLAQWYTMSRDFRALRLLNGMVNKCFETVDTTTWLGSYPHGARHDSPSVQVYTSALAVLALLAERLQSSGAESLYLTDAKVLSQWDVQVGPFLQAFPGGNIPYGIARAIGSVIPTTLAACAKYQVRL